MYRFLLRPRWIGFHLLVVTGIVVMINLGLWQLDRLDERRDFNARVEQRAALPPAPLDEVLAVAGATGTTPGDERPDGLDEIEWRRVEVTGTYLPDEQLLVVNRSQNGRAGDNVVTPMQLADGRILLVTRGFVPIGFGVPPPPGGAGQPVTVSGIVRLSQERRLGQLSDPATGRLIEVQRLDIDRIAPQLPGPAVPVSLDVLASNPPEAPGVPEPVARPDLSDGPHLSYAIQWFIFATAVGVGWVLAVRWSVTRRQATAVEEAATDDEPATEPERTPLP